MDLLSGLDVESIKTFLGDALSHDFSRMLFLFAAAALIHGKQVRKEIRTQFGALIDVLKEDLDAQKSVLGKLAMRVDNIEAKLNSKGE